MVYKKFKDFKLEIIRMIFEEANPSEICKRIEELEQSSLITPSQITYLVDLVYNSVRFTMTGSEKHKYVTQILVYKKKIIASYMPERGVYLE